MGMTPAAGLRRESTSSRSARGDVRPMRVVVIYKDLPHYRIRFFEVLRDLLQLRGADLDLVYGQAAGDSKLRRDKCRLEWAHFVRSYTITIWHRTVYWQPVLRFVNQADLVIVEQANSLLVNYLLIVMRRFGLLRLAFWGHGRNYQAREPHSLRERFKRQYSKSVDWWFAYSESSVALVESLGFPPERITCVGNAIDTSILTHDVDSIRSVEVRALMDVLGLNGTSVCLYVGGMYPEKRLDFLLEAAVLIRARVPDFELVFIGAGSDQQCVERFARLHSWARYIGPVFGRDLAAYYAASRLLLSPGAVGLGVLDSFAAGVPLVTTAGAMHGPEFDYVVQNVNGVVVPESDAPETYATVVAELLRDPVRHGELVRACRESARLHTVEGMANRFAEGVLAAVAAS